MSGRASLEDKIRLHHCVGSGLLPCFFLDMGAIRLGAIGWVAKGRGAIG